MQHGGNGHSSSGSRGNKKIGTPDSAKGVADASSQKQKTAGGKSAKSATAYKCHEGGMKY